MIRIYIAMWKPGVGWFQTYPYWSHFLQHGNHFSALDYLAVSLSCCPALDLFERLHDWCCVEGVSNDWLDLLKPGEPCFCASMYPCSPPWRATVSYSFLYSCHCAAGRLVLLRACRTCDMWSSYTKRTMTLLRLMKVGVQHWQDLTVWSWQWT